MEDVTDYTPEHQSAKNVNTTNPVGYTPTPDEQKTIRLVDSLYKKAKLNRSKYDGKWLEYYKFFRGKQWREQRPSYRHSEVINLVFESIQSTVPIQTDARPRMQFVPSNPLDTEFAEIMNKVSESDWERGNWLEVLTEILYDSNFYGKGIGALEVDPTGDFGGPKIEFVSKDPFYQYPDPAAIDCNKKCKYWIESEPVDIEVLKKDYPKHAQYIKSDIVDLENGDKTNLDKARYKSPVDNRAIMDNNGSYDLTDRNQCLKITCYIAPENYEDEDNQGDRDPITDSNNASFANPTIGHSMGAPLEGVSGAQQPEEKKKCPNGRKIVVASGCLLFDGENPYDDKKFPYAGISNYTLPREFWGISEVEQLMGPNKIYNKVISFTLDVMTLMGNPIWIVDTTAGVDADNLFNRPGLVVEKEPGSEVRREEGVALQPYILPLLDRVRQMFDGISGAKDITRPVEDNSVTAASAITAIQEAAQTRLRLKARHLDAFLQDLGQMYVERVMQFYSAPKIVRVIGNDSGFKYFKFHVEDVLDAEGNPVMNEYGKPKKQAVVRNFTQNLETGKIAEDLEATSFEIHGQLDVRVSTGSSLPFSKNEAGTKAMKLYTIAPPPGGGVIDAEELLTALDYPNKEAVLQRMKEKQDAMAQAAQAQQAQPPR